MPVYLIEDDIACYRSLIDWITNKESKIIQKRWTKASKTDIYRDKYRVIYPTDIVEGTRASEPRLFPTG